MTDTPQDEVESQPVNAEVYADANDRLENTLEAQQQQIVDINSQRQTVLKFAPVFLALLISATSALLAYSTGQVWSILANRILIVSSAIIATLSFVGAMVAALFSNLDENQEPGFVPHAIRLTESDYNPDLVAHLQQTTCDYVETVKANQQRIDEKTKWLQRALLGEISGVIFSTVTIATVLPVGISAKAQLFVPALGIVLLIAGLTRYKSSNSDPNETVSTSTALEGDNNEAEDNKTKKQPIEE
ncbi:hypothetical protein MUK72_15170 (plasmid) [Halococcus dombrowskii]|uniref:Uncharacterized protein n=1 Tax=Halococcus dombrowskii TaxID=179637 RepID=A0AAV3SBU0_HALDO|nr:hypothetical protein [Halococcus dombrowskii]UOO96860.1 hypothetical protein MUK72_15170 [Halococcus dombrowskii]